jgi:hypothetical protein
VALPVSQQYPAKHQFFPTMLIPKKGGTLW